MQSFKQFGDYILQNSRHGENPSDWVHIIVNYPKIQWDDWAEYMATLTWFSGIPLSKGGSKNTHVIFAENIDEGLSKSDQYKYAIVSYIGSFYYSDHQENIFTYFEKFRNSNRPCRGHLLFHPDKQYGRLHPQTIFLDIDHWRKIGRPSFGYYTGKVIEYQRSMSNVHDDYTPHWVRGGSSYVDVENVEQGEYITKVLEDGHTILNFDGERRVKFFCYPERRHSAQLESEQNRESNIVYVKNNEALTRACITAGFTDKFDVIYAPAAGCTAEYLYHRYGHANSELIIYDNNLDSIRWKRMTYDVARTESDLERIAEHFRGKKGCRVDACEYKPELVQRNEAMYSTQQWLDTIAAVTPKIIQFDILSDGPFNVDPSKKTLIHLSNIFSYNFVIHRMKIEEINDKFLQYYNLPNTTLIGKTPFKDDIRYENRSS